jgi:hypothetical protein
VLVGVSASASGTATGIVSGIASVTSAPGQVDLAAAGQVTVKAWKLNTDGVSATNVASTVTASSGNWQFASLPIGQYDFEYDFKNSVVGAYKDGPAFQGGGVRLDDEIAGHSSGGTQFVSLPADTPSSISGVTLPLGDNLSGVVDDRVAHPLAGQTVKLFIQGFDAHGAKGAYPYATTTTAGNGTYSFTNLPTGVFVPEAGGSNGYAMQDSNGDYYASPYPDAQDVELSAPNQSAVADFALFSGASIGGTVKNTSNAAIGGILVSAFYDLGDAINGIPIETATTSSTGAYTLANLPASDEIVLHFASRLSASVQYHDSWWQDEPIADWADPIELAAGAHLTGYSVRLSRAGSITGVISTADHGALTSSDVSIEACPIESYDSETYADCEGTDPGVIAANGTYKIGGVAPGTYTVFVNYHGSGNYQDEFFANNYTGENTSKFKVAAGGTTANINVALDPGGILSGTVSSSGVPMSGETVSAPQNFGATAVEGHSDAGDHYATTDSNGNYTIKGLSAGNYGVELEPNNEAVATQWFPGVSAEDLASTFTVTALSVHDSIDFNEVGTGTIHGHVLDAMNDAALDGAEVDVKLVNGTGAQSSGDNVDASTTTDNNGSYTVTGLPPGDYRIAVDAGDGVHLAQDIGGVPGEADSHVPVLALGAGQDAQEDVLLQRGGSYTGTVVDSNGHGIRNVDVFDNDFYNYGYATSDAITNSSGVFTLTGLLPGAHSLSFWSYDDSYSTRTIEEPAVAVNSASVPLGQIELLHTTGIRGVVVGTNGKPVTGVDVMAVPKSSLGGITFEGSYYGTDDVTAKDGTFSIYGLDPGSYYLELTPPAGSAYATQFMGGSTDPTLSEAVDVTAEGTTAYREVHIVGGGSITGVVTNKKTGKAIAGVEVTAAETSIAGENDFGGFDGTGTATTNSKGAYVIPGLTPGSYDVSFNDPNSGEPNLAYASASATAFVRDKTTTTRNAALLGRVHVSGRVLDSTGAPAGHIRVQAFPYVNGVAQFGDGIFGLGQSEQPRAGLDLTDDQGNYSLSLLPGTYVLEFITAGDSGATTFLGGTDVAADSTKIVAVGAPIANQNIQLPTYSGAISFNLVGASAEPLEGFITVDRLDDSKTTVLSSESIGDELFGPAQIDGATTIANLAPGWYNVTIDAFTDDNSYNEVVRQTYVAGGPNDLGEIDLTDPVSGEQLLEPQADPGDPPTIDASDGVQVGDTLIANPGSWIGSPTTYFYHWLRNGHQISGATGATYTLQPGDANARISLSIGASSYEDFRNLSYTTDALDPVALGTAANVTANPTVTGTARVGSTLTAKPGHWDLPGVTFTYKWTRTVGAGIPVSVSTSSTYKPTTADVPVGGLPTTLDLLVTAHRVGFEDSTPFDVSVSTIVPAVALIQTHASSVSHNSTTGLYSVAPGSWSPTGGVISYEWREYPAGSTTPTTLGSGSTLSDSIPTSTTTRLTVVVTDTKPGYATRSVEVPVRTGEAVVILTSPTLNAPTLQPNFIATINSDAVTAPVNASFSRQWLRNGAAIKGAIGRSYVFTTADVGRHITVRIVASATGHIASLPQTLDVGTVTAAVAFAGTVPVITGNPAVGRTLTAIIPNWAPAPTSVAYQWYRGAAPISNATGKAYVPTSADVGQQLSVHVSGGRSGYATIVGVSDLTSAITAAPISNLTPPSVATVTKVGATLTASVGKWDVTPTSYRYQWLRNGNPIPYATSSTYVVLPSDLADDISVTVQPVKAGLLPTTPLESNAVTVQPGAAVVATKAPALTVGGKTVTFVVIGNVINATAGTWPAVALDLTYQWQVDRHDGSGFVNLAGETGHQLYLSSDSADATDFAVGYSYHVVVSATRVGYLDSPPTVSAALTMQ